MSLAKILQICYEPYVALAGVGLLICIILRRWKMVAGGAALLIFMISWRLGMGGNGSSRYGLAVIFPVLYFVSVAGIGLEKFVNKKFPEFSKRYFFVVFTAAVSLMALGKVFRFDSDRNTALKAGEAIRKNAQQFASAILMDHTNQKGKVAGFYAGVPVAGKKYWREIGGLEADIMLNEAFNYTQFYEAVYFLVKDKKHGAGLEKRKEFVHVAIDNGDDSFAVYRVTNAGRKTIVQKNVIKNGDFSQVKPFAIKVPRDRQLSCPSGLMPEKWFANFGHGYSIGSNAIVEVAKAWDDNCLRICSDKGAAVVAEEFIAVGSGVWDFYTQYKLNKGSWSLIVYRYDSRKQYRGYDVIDSMSFISRKTVEYKNRIVFDENSDIAYFRPVFEVGGELFLDNIYLTEMKLDK